MQQPYLLHSGLEDIHSWDDSAWWWCLIPAPYHSQDEAAHLTYLQLKARSRLIIIQQ